MTDHTLDHWRDRMVSALYGELESEEEHELLAAIAHDEALQHDWQELKQVHCWIGEANSAADLDGPEIDLPLDLNPVMQKANEPVVIRRRWLLPAAAGFAIAATLFAGLLVAGLRIDHTPAGLLVRLDRADEVISTPPAGPVLDLGRLREDTVSRAEMALLMQGVLEVSAARLDEMERRQTSNQTELTRALYGALVDRQQQHYADLRTRIDLAAYRDAQQGLSVPGRQIPLHTTKENHDDTY